MHAPESGYTVRHALHGDWVSYVSGLITAYCILYCYLLPFRPRAGNPRGGEIINNSLWRLQVGPKAGTYF